MSEGDDQQPRKCDGRRVGFNGIARAVCNLAIELNAVPCGVGRAGFGGVRASAPCAPCGLSGFFVIPLVAQTGTLRLDGNSEGVAERDCLILRLPGNAKNIGKGDFCGFGIGCFAASVRHLAVNLHTVPCGIGSGGSGCRCASAPFGPCALSGFLVVPLIAQPFALRLHGELYAVAGFDRDTGGMRGDRQRN